MSQNQIRGDPDAMEAAAQPVGYLAVRAQDALTACAKLIECMIADGRWADSNARDTQERYRVVHLSLTEGLAELQRLHGETTATAGRYRASPGRR